MLLYLYVILGIAATLWGADRLTDGASAIARYFNVSELTIGLIIVSFGVSMPEFIISIIANIEGHSAIAVGNVVGSNIFNILVIVGCSAIVSPIVVGKHTLRVEIPVCVLATVLFLWFAFNDQIWGSVNHLSKLEGLIMLCFFAAFFIYIVFIAKKDGIVAGMAIKMKLWKGAIFFILGVLCLVGGSYLLLSGSIGIAKQLNVSEFIIALLPIACGTSLPQLSGSIIAARKGHSAIAIGSAVGSCIFNLLFILGFCSLVKPMSFDSISIVDGVVLLFATLLVWCFAYSKRIVERWEGIVMLSIFLAFVIYTIAQA